MNDELLTRVAVALERLTDHFAPAKERRAKLPPILSSATYTWEERNRKELRERFTGTASKPAGRSSAPTRTDL